MRFKIDENLPVELMEALQAAGYDADTVPREGLAGQPDEVVFNYCQQEERILVTMDKGFGDIRSYAPGTHAGIIILRPPQHSRDSFLHLMEQVMTLLTEHELQGRLWIVEAGRVRMRGIEA